MATSGVGDVGRAGCVVDAGWVFEAGCVGDAGVADVPLAGVGDAGGWPAGCCVAVDVLRLVDGRRLVCAIDANEKNRISIAGKTSVGRRFVEDFIRVP